MTVNDRAALNLPWSDVDDLWIGDRWVPAGGGDQIAVTDPAVEEAWGHVPDASPADVDAAVSAARNAFRTGPWPRMSAAERALILLRMADELEADTEALAATVTRENGSTITETRGAAGNAAGILRYFASLAPYLDEPDIRSAPGGASETVVRREPRGVCALIAPWNFPINLVAIKLAPALLAGNTAVIKPAPETPLSARFLVRAAHRAGVPSGVISMITGAAVAGEALVRHPDVAKVAFTGSTPVGRRIGATCGELLKPVTLELGGKSAALVLPDVDVESMSAVLLRTCLRNSGQTCYISSRVLVPRERYDEVTEMIVDTVASARVGDPFDEATQFGPVANHGQYQRVRQRLDEAAADGAKALTGGHAIEGRGYFIAPTVFAAEPGMRIARDEVFGPVLTVLRYDGLEEGIALADDTDFGLGGTVFSADEDMALDVAARLDTGSVGLNFFASNHAAPFSGRHASGLGVEYGREGLGEYTTFKSIHRRTTH